MAAIITRRSWRRQPPGSVVPNFSHPLLADLNVIFNGTHGSWAQLGWAMTGAQTVVDDRLGMGSQTDGSHYFAQSIKLPPADWTIAALFTFVSGGVSTTLMGVCEDPGSGINDRSIRVDPTGAKISGYLYDGAPEYATSVKSLSSIVGVAVTVVVTAIGSRLAIYMDGVIGVGSSVSNSGYTGYATPVFAIGNASDGPGASNVALAMLVNRGWGSAEVSAFNENPWQVFSPRTRRLYSVASAPSSGFFARQYYDMIGHGGVNV